MNGLLHHCLEKSIKLSKASMTVSYLAHVCCLYSLGHMYTPIKDAWHENVEKINLAKTCRYWSVFIWISHPQWKNWKLQSCLEVLRENCAYVMLFIVLFSVVTTFSTFQATFLLISPEVFGILTPNFSTSQIKYDKTFGTKARVGLKIFGGWCCASCQEPLI